MPERQLRLFPAPKPLIERLGEEFFRCVPKRPGVYLMHDRAERLLYVGKARDLRRRLASYRCVAPERASRKTVRLIHAVESIEWELCDSEEAACLRENELLRVRRPRFNRIGTYPKAQPFVQLQETGAGFTMRISRVAGPDCFGAFKGSALQSFAALARLLWSAVSCGGEYSELPRELIVERPSREVTFAADAAPWKTVVRDFLAGVSDELVHKVEECPSTDGDFFASFRRADTGLLRHFFEFGPRRNLLLRERFALTGPNIAPELLDDLLVKSSIRDRFAVARDK